jgi:molybdopterin/thiamine biosynthesis adenylyltransferase
MSTIPSSETNSADFERYSRQIRFPPIGKEGQRRLSQSSATVIGCGALGTVISNTLTRAGVGRLRIVDRDFVEISNLQRQVLFDEEDVKSNLPKAIAAVNKLARINSEILLEPVVTDVDPFNIETLVADSDIVLDGSDNFEIRFLINDICVKRRLPWIYGGCLGAEGQTMTILPGETACLNCLMLDGPPPPGTTPTCDSFGIVSPAINVIAAVESMEAIKILSGNVKAIRRDLLVISLWDNHFRSMNIATLRERVECPCCKKHRFEWLEGDRGSQTAILCGRNAVQLSFKERSKLSLESLAARLTPLGRVEQNSFLLKFYTDPYCLTVFPDGRTIVSGTEDVSLARRLHAQFLGN